jgi:antitoxin (DNA-binding transcriptional repressor) of toxin-antitoxin stability system
METINISEAKSRFSEFLSRAASGERFIIVRGPSEQPGVGNQ